MEQKTVLMLVAMLVVGAVVGYGVSAMTAPKPTTTTTTTSTTPVTVYKAPLAGQTVKYADIQGSNSEMETAKPLEDTIILPAINEWAKKLGYDVKFEALLDSADGQAATHLEKVQSFKSLGVSLLIGGRYSSHAQASLPYCNSNSMLLFSPSSTSPILAMPNDNLFRMCPVDNLQASAISKMLTSFGIKAVVIIQTADAYGDGVYNILEKEYPADGGVIVQRIRIAAETTEFSNYLATAENFAKDAVAKYGKNKVGIQLLLTSGATTLITQSEDYPVLWSLPWFGTDTTCLVQQMIDDAPSQINHLRIYSTNPAPGESLKYVNFKNAYKAMSKQWPGYYATCTYDIATVLTTSTVEVQSQNAKDVIPVLPYVAANNFGVSGWTRLNENGDRATSDYYFWGYGTVDGKVDNVQYGKYDSLTGTATWFPEVLGFNVPV